MSDRHTYNITTKWTGNNNVGTRSYTSYERSYSIETLGKDTILGSSDPNYRGDKTKVNPEELFLSAISSCHMLWYLHLCSDAGIVVMDYVDNATGSMSINTDGGGQFDTVQLNPIVKIGDGRHLEEATMLHKQAHKKCFIANSVNFKILCQPIISV